MDKIVNCINFKGLFTFVEKNYGKSALDKLLKEALSKDEFLIENKSDPTKIEKVTEKHLKDDAYWISYDLSVAILSSIKKVVPGKRPEYSAGLRVVLETLSNRELFICRFMGTRALIKRASKINARFNRSKDVSVTSLEKNKATLELKYKPDCKVRKEVCEWNLGIYEGIAVVSGAKTIRVYESKCTVDSNDACEFTIEWQEASFFSRVSKASLRLFTKSFFDEYERTVRDRDFLIEKLKESEKRYRQLVEDQTDFVVRFDLKGRFSFVNASFCKMFGKTREEFEGESLFKYLYEKDRKTTEEEIKIIFRPPNTGRIDKRAVTKDGIRWIAWVATAVKDENDRITAVNAVGRDITEKKKIEEVLKEKEQLFKLITDNTKALVAIHDSAGNYVYVSPSHESMGYTSEELMGKSSFSMLDKRDFEKMMGFLNDGREKKISRLVTDYRLVSKEGKVFDFRGAFDGVYDEKGNLEKIVSVADDITELKRAQSLKENALYQASEARKLALVGQVAGKMAHDFNNILSIIMGISELSVIDCEEGKLKNNFELILNQTKRGKNLTRNLVAFAKSSEPKQKFFKVNDTVNMVIELLKKDIDNILLKVDLGPEIPELLADPGMIEHALVNLIQNSIHALSRSENPVIQIKTYSENESVIVEVKDNGCGIPDVHIGSIYDPSFTLKGSKDATNSYRSDIKGTGYGMANVKKYIEQHRGTIKVESTEGEGTSFVISLPVTKRELTSDERSSIEDHRQFFGKYGLVVEDEPDMANIQYSVLTGEPCNHRIDIASNGKIALDLIERNNYDFITLDYILPGDINGMDIYRKIREKNKKIPVLFVSGNIEFLESIENLKLNDKNLEHLSKPCSNLEFVQSINLIIGTNTK